MNSAFGSELDCSLFSSGGGGFPFGRQSNAVPRANLQGAEAEPRVRGVRADFGFALPGARTRPQLWASLDPNRDWLPVCHSRAGRTPAGALPGKFSAKLGMSPQQGKLPVERAPIQCPRARTRNGPHLDRDSGVRARELPGDQASGGDPGRGGELTRFLKTRFLLPYFCPSLTSLGTSPGQKWEKEAVASPGRRRANFTNSI
ncbi:PREDICTED: uncharacterized protein LOC105593660 [Cercocebus atys]|uniref:uncharacterized protein LOC105593660 n=1 Tax=Cercocebus atys TaxID=9531 RepID=UPI0005F49EB0|nr:PREDICTED: uncharacterized protein LOC105593660 [Cercocebus atys]